MLPHRAAYLPNLPQSSPARAGSPAGGKSWPGSASSGGLPHNKGARCCTTAPPKGATAISRQRFGRSVALLLDIVACLAAAGITGLALANAKPTLATARNSTLGETIVVDSHGLTVYELSPETIHHLLCT